VGTGFSDIRAGPPDGGHEKRMSLPVQSQHRLHLNRQFSYVYRRGARASCKDLSILYVRNAQKRVGFSVGKKVGVAVVRNRTKRRLRECFRHLTGSIRPGFYVVVARPSAAERSYGELCQSVNDLLGKLKVFSQPPREEGKRP
jgi:ribonuclease P protein component